jgi:flagellar hook assembly protein FlgD
VLVAPDKTTRMIETAQRTPGTYRFTWPGTDELEGQWRFSVTATDDRGQTSTADRLFSVNRTLSSLQARPASLRLGKQLLTGSVLVAHPAQVSVTIETPTNIVLRVLTRAKVEPGTLTFTWNGRDSAKKLVASGRLQVHVVATNDLGRVDLRTLFTAHR